MLTRLLMMALATLFIAFWVPVILEQHTLKATDVCWFYDFNLGEHSLSEQLTLAFFAIAAVMATRLFRQTKQRVFLAFALVCAFCFLEEANYGQVFFDASSQYNDADQLSFHTQNSWTQDLHLFEILLVTVQIVFPIWLYRAMHLSSPAYVAAACVPTLVAFFLAWHVEAWVVIPPKVDGRYVCSVLPEEIIETIMACAASYFMFLCDLSLDARPKAES